jgi:lipoyl(octanoyl) transferase
MKTGFIVDLGLVEYGAAWELQRRIVAARKAGAVPDVLLLCRHPHVITLGRNGKLANLRASDHVLRQMGVTFFETDRGGDITYHGPGQLVGYPILDLKPDRCDVHRYVRDLEEVLIRTAGDYGMTAQRIEGLTGVWIGEEKLAAIGVRIARWVTSHGFALNVTTDLEYFNLIVPCGIVGRGVTSLERLVGGPVNRHEVEARLIAHFCDVFERTPSAIREASALPQAPYPILQ